MYGHVCVRVEPAVSNWYSMSPHIPKSELKLQNSKQGLKDLIHIALFYSV